MTARADTSTQTHHREPELESISYNGSLAFGGALLIASGLLVAVRLRRLHRQRESVTPSLAPRPPAGMSTAALSRIGVENHGALLPSGRRWPEGPDEGAVRSRLASADTERRTATGPPPHRPAFGGPLLPRGEKGGAGITGRRRPP